ncbi:hypothetical protein [Achromobacter sp. AONIH1]|uniref:hypothetical protein n=1 Tax=Achromobacter sp. AONIH1 TaxID=1758194 RepID=UPI000CD183DD|nr:hypothetical protein [Achromobacter sp. AONIH1]AUT49838.1 hypothetical protein C2U31_29985 [Achromobacter sp. AONIH1]
MELTLPGKLHKALEREAQDAKRTLHAHLVRKLENVTPPIDTIDPRPLHANLPRLTAYLDRVPGVRVLSSEVTPDAYWWVKLTIDIADPLAWRVVQELGFVLNDLSLEDKLPTVFKPVSPPPYLNGGPEECLAWVIESSWNYIDPGWIADTLEGYLPRPVDQPGSWSAQ